MKVSNSSHNNESQEGKALRSSNLFEHLDDDFEIDEFIKWQLAKDHIQDRDLIPPKEENSSDYF